MSFADDFKDLCNQTVTREPYSSRDGYGKPTYGAAVSLTECRVVYKNKLVRSKEGDLVTSTAQVWDMDATDIDVRDRLTLPDGDQPQIIRVERPADETGNVTHTKVYL